MLVVRSNVAEDSVWIDGRDVGPSGAHEHEVAVGRHVVEVRSDIGEEMREVELEAGETKTVRFRFVRSTPSPTPVVDETTLAWTPGSGRCRNLDECVKFSERGLDRSRCGGELTVSFRNSCDEALVAKVCSQGKDGRASCQFVHASAKGRGVGRFCDSSGRYLWAARNLDSPGGRCWPARLEDGARVTAEVSKGGQCTILDHCISFTSKSLDPYECGGKLTLELQNTCARPVVAMVCGRRNDGTQTCGQITEVGSGSTAVEEICNSAGAYKFAARSLGDRGAGCWPVGFATTVDLE